MRITVLCEEPERNKDNTDAINKMLESFDESNVEIQVYYLEQTNNLMPHLLKSDLILADGNSLTKIIQQPNREEISHE